MMLKAYTVSWSSMPGITTTISAENAGKAKYHAYLLARDYGRPDARFTEFAARRAPEYDDLAQRKNGTVFSSEIDPWFNDDGTGRPII